MNICFIKQDNCPVIVIPIYKLPIDAIEAISLSAMRKHLSKYVKHFIIPERVQINNFEIHDNEFITRMPDRYFQSTDSYNGLLTSVWFYEQFIEFTHMLIYQLDCLVFSDQLLDLCCRDWDYIGSPMLKYSGDPNIDADWVIGNGGLSLRKIRSFLRVLKRISPKAVYFNPRTRTCDAPDFERGYFPDRSSLRFPLIEKMRSLIAGWSVENEVYGFRANEDIFWSMEANKFDSNFRVAPFEAGRQFAFEKHPGFLFQKNANSLPFGCHAWNKYEPDFWNNVAAL